jgi:hypothetical protein
MLSLSPTSHQEIIHVFNNTSRYLDDILTMTNPYFDQLVSKIYPSELKLNKTNSSDVITSFIDLNISIIKNTLVTKIYEKRDDFDFNIVNYPRLDGLTIHV